MVKNDFSAQLLIEDLSFEGQGGGEKVQMELAVLLHETCWLGRVIRSKRRQTEAEHEGTTKEGQNKEPE